MDKDKKVFESKEKLRRELEEVARKHGFCAFGIARADAAPKAAERLRDWLASGAHGEMIWMEETQSRRGSPEGLWPEARSVIALGMSYAPEADPLALAAEPERGRISVYAQGADYHDVVKKALKRVASWLAGATGGPSTGSGQAEVKVFVDTAPVMEKPLAEAAGLGWQGKHTNLVSRSHGSWLFLGAIYTTLELPPDAPHEERCGSCTACLSACPTDAFPAPFQLDARRCISYLTIEHKGPIPEEFREAIGNRIYGCDDCLAVCPWNRFAAAAQANMAFRPRAELAAPALADLLALDEAAFRKIFAGSPIKRIGRGRMVRNAAIAAGNSGRAELIPVLERLADDEDPGGRRGGGAGRWRGSGAAERGDALGPVGVAAVRQARIDMGRDRIAAAARRIEIDIEHAGRPEELKLARIALTDVEAGRAEEGGEGRARRGPSRRRDPAPSRRGTGATGAGRGAGGGASGRRGAGATQPAASMASSKVEKRAFTLFASLPLAPVRR